jgi:hypothetical protein
LRPLRLKKIANGKSIQEESTKQSICFVYNIDCNGVVTSPPNPSGDANDGSVHAMTPIKPADFQCLRPIEEMNPKFSFLRSQKRKLRRINGKSGYFGDWNKAKSIRQQCPENVGTHPEINREQSLGEQR